MDVSPLFTGPRLSTQAIFIGCIKREKTPRAISYFAKHCSVLNEYEYWFLLGTLWVSYTGFSDLRLWKRLLSANIPNREPCIMKPSELKAFEQLPPVFRAFRAHRPGESDWISYTIDTEAAERFARRRSVEQVTEYELKREDCIALFLRRGESEILMLDKSKAIPVQNIPVKL